MTNHPRRDGRRKHQRQLAARPRLLDVCSWCLCVGRHLPECPTHDWALLAALDRLPRNADGSITLSIA